MKYMPLFISSFFIGLCGLIVVATASAELVNSVDVLSYADETGYTYASDGGFTMSALSSVDLIEKPLTSDEGNDNNNNITIDNNIEPEIHTNNTNNNKKDIKNDNTNLNTNTNEITATTVEPNSSDTEASDDDSPAVVAESIDNKNTNANSNVRWSGVADEVVSVTPSVVSRPLSAMGDVLVSVLMLIAIATACLVAVIIKKHKTK